MNYQNNYVVIMAGGVGTRLWPFSRTNYPKQFHDILGIGKTLLQQTIARFKDVCPIQNIFIVTNEIYKDLVKEQVPELTDEQILLEPVKRNTAPCIAYATHKIALKNPAANMVIAPADHIIFQEENFRKTILKALEETENKESLVTLGIKPTRPDTGYGYIQFIDESPSEAKRVKTFTEKPTLDIAVKFLESGEFVWNAGIFVWNAKTINEAFKTYLPEVSSIFEEAQQDFYSDQESTAIKKAYSFCKSISIDIGIMEKADNVHVILSDFDWSDLGTWKSLYENSDKDNQGNVITGNAMIYDTKNCIIKTPEEKLVVVQGLENCIVAEYDGVLLICDKDQEQKVRDFVSDAKNKGNQFI